MHKNMKQSMKDQVSVHKTGFRLLKQLHGMDSSAIPLSLISAFLEAGKPYITLFFTSEIIDRLLLRQFRMTYVLVGAMLILRMAVGLSLNQLNRNLRIRYRNIQLRFKLLIRKKAMELDYETMEDPKTVEKICFTERTCIMYGSIETILSHYRDLLMYLLTMLASIGLVAVLCLSKPERAHGILSMIASVPISCILILIAIAVMLLATRKISTYFSIQQKKIFDQHTDTELRHSYLSRLSGDYKIAKVVRIYQMKNVLMKNIMETNEKNRQLYQSMGDVGRKQDVVEMGVNSIFALLSYLIVGIKVLAHGITVGAFTKYAGALTQLGTAFNHMIWQNQYIKRNCMYMKEFLEFMELPNKRDTGSIPIEKRIDHVYEIEFHDVSFHYPHSEELILKHINCKLTLKDKMAVVGRNGAGKTTFIKLLCRLYDPTEGVITLNGVDIRKYDYEEYLTLFSVVFQDYSLLSFAVDENIAAGKEIQEEKLKECLSQAGADEVVAKLPNGVKTSLYQYEEEGVEVSGGESQKIAIARALYKNAPFVILDEPTAALDPLSEYEIYKRFHEMTADKTSIYISHRMSSCRFCDDIIVFDQGQIVERGSHDVLMQNNQIYAQLWNAQAQYYV